jgi:ABC-2 type transport system permease protein
MVLVVIPSLLTQTVGRVGVNVGDDAEKVAATANWDGIHSLINFSGMSSFLIYFLISLFVVTIGQDLSKGLLKNLFSSGVSRSHFFLSKYLVFNVIALIQFVLYYALTFIVGSIVNGVGSGPANFLGRFIGAFAMQLLLLQAVFAVGLVILYLTFKPVWSVLTIIIFPLVVAIVGSVMKLDWMKYLDFQGSMGSTFSLPHKELIGLLISSCAVLIICVGASYTYFQKKDL